MTNRMTRTNTNISNMKTKLPKTPPTTGAANDCTALGGRAVSIDMVTPVEVAVLKDRVISTTEVRGVVAASGILVVVSMMLVASK